MDLNPNLDLSSTTYHKWKQKQEELHAELLKSCYASTVCTPKQQLYKMDTGINE